MQIKKIFLTLSMILPLVLNVRSQSGSVGIGTTTPNASAVLDIQSTEKGILVPRMTTLQRNAINNAATGLLVFDNTTGSFWFRNSSNWVELIDTLNNLWKMNGTNIYSPLSANVGLGVTNPTAKLEINGDLRLRHEQSDADFGYFRKWNTLDLNINSLQGSIISGARASNLILQVGNPSTFVTAGNVGIGTNTPEEKLEVSGNLKVSGEINRSATGTANLVPFAYGKVSSSGAVISGTGNFSVSNSGGLYTITIPSMPTNAQAQIIITPAILFLSADNPEARLVTPVASKRPGFPEFEVILWSLLEGLGGLATSLTPVSCEFSFVVYIP
jgi:hypothetical protein